MHAEEIQAALLYLGCVSLLWAFAHGFAPMRTLSNRLGTAQHGWLDTLVILSGISLLAWPFVPGTLIYEYDFDERWHVAVLTFLGAWIAGVFLGWVVLAILAPASQSGADEFETGARFLRWQYPVMAGVVVATIALWWGTMDQLRY